MPIIKLFLRHQSKEIGITFLKNAVMIALIVLVIFSAIGIVAVIHAIKNAPFVEERDDSKIGQ